MLNVKSGEDKAAIFFFLLLFEKNNNAISKPTVDPHPPIKVYKSKKCLFINVPFNETNTFLYTSSKTLLPWIPKNEKIDENRLINNPPI